MTKTKNLAIVFDDILHDYYTGRKRFKVSLQYTSSNKPMIVGTEWLVEAAGCDGDSLRDERTMQSLFDRIIDDLGLKSVGAVWHKFPGEGGVTGLVALTESHLACHTYPEYGTATINLYCCRTRPEWDWEVHLRSALGAKNVFVHRIERGNELSHIAGGDA